MVEGEAGLVALPSDAGQVVACMKVAAQHGLDVVPRGSGTGLAGAATPVGRPLVVVTAKMTRLLEVRADDRLAWVEPGVLNLDLSTPSARPGSPTRPTRRASRPARSAATSPPTPAARTAWPPGVTAQHILGMESCWPTGGARLGGEGPRPPATTSAGSSWAARERSASSPRSASASCDPTEPCARCSSTSPQSRRPAQTVGGIIAAGVVPAAMEMMDRRMTVAVEAFVHADCRWTRPRCCWSRSTAPRPRSPPTPLWSSGRAPSTAPAACASPRDEAERRSSGRRRKSAFGAVARVAPNYYLHDCVVPRTRLVEVLDGDLRDRAAHDLVIMNVFHAGDGNLHPLIAFDCRAPGRWSASTRPATTIVGPCVDGGRRALRRARDRPGEARLHAARLQRRGPRGAGVRADGVRPRGADEPAKVLPDGAGAATSPRRRWRATARSRRARGSDPSARRSATSRRRSALRPPTVPAYCSWAAAGTSTRATRSRSTPRCGRRCWMTSSRTTRPRCSSSSRGGCGSRTSPRSSARPGRSGRSTPRPTRP